jgi:L-cysteine desulfidase
LKGDEKGYTWCNGSNTPTSRKDYILLSNSFCYQCENVKLQHIPGSHSNGTRMSDHKSLIFSFIVNENLRGPGYWKFNTSLIENEDFTYEINVFLKNHKTLHMKLMCF